MPPSDAGDLGNTASGPRRVSIFTPSFALCPWGGWVRRALVLAFSGVYSCSAPAVSKFPDRPVAVYEHDDEDVRALPAEDRWAEYRLTHSILDFLVREVDRALAVETPVPASDVNAMDEVPCSTWYCPRNHVRPLSTEALMRGPPEDDPPALPLRVIGGKEGGRARGFAVEDARGRRFLIKLDSRAHPGMRSGAELVASRLIYAAGYNVPGSFALDVGPGDLLIDPRATYEEHGFERRSFTPEHLGQILAETPHVGGRARLLAVAWIKGRSLGAFDFIGTRSDDPNDRIPHEHRRSLRGLWVLCAWLNLGDVNAANTVDSLVNVNGRHFVRHYLIDFDGGLGAWGDVPKWPHKGKELAVDIERTGKSMANLGLWERNWQQDRPEWKRAVASYPAVGWIEGEGWSPRNFYPLRKVPAFLRRTPRDEYWGAKIVMSFTDAQIEAAVGTGGYAPEEARMLADVLKYRRDIIGRTYLLPYTAVEAPRMNGQDLCFADLAILRGLAAARDMGYRFQVVTDRGEELEKGEIGAQGSSTCIPIGKNGTYQVVRIGAVKNGVLAWPVFVHLKKRAHGLAVVGMEAGSTKR